ncbi:ATP6 synthase, partial [Acromyrmex insinuator]
MNISIIIYTVIVQIRIEFYLILVRQPGIFFDQCISLIIRSFTLAVCLANIIVGHLLHTLLDSSETNIFYNANFLILISTHILPYILEISVSIIHAYVFSILSTLHRRETFNC